jgi:hypothetical protein
MEPACGAVDDRIVIIKKDDWEIMKWKMENLELDMRIYKEVIYSHMQNLNAHKEGFKP